MARSLLEDHKLIWNTARTSQFQASRQSKAELRLAPVSGDQKQPSEKRFSRLLECQIAKTPSDQKSCLRDEELLQQEEERRRWEKERLGHEKTRQLWEQERLNHENARHRWDRERVDHENACRQWEKERVEHEELNLKRGEERRNHETTRKLWEQECVEHANRRYQWEKEHVDHEGLSRQREKECRMYEEIRCQWDEDRRQWEEQRCANEKIYVEWEEERRQWHFAGVLHAQKCLQWKGLCHQRETQLEQWEEGWTRFVHNWDILSSLSIPSNGRSNAVLNSWPDKVSMRLLRSEGVGQGFFDKISRTSLWSEHGFSKSMRNSLHGHKEGAMWASARFAHGIKAAFNTSRDIK